MLLRIFVDAVINHMCGYGSGTGHGSAGSWYNSLEMRFPGVPYGPYDFNCCHCQHRCTTSSCNIDNYGDTQQVTTFGIVRSVVKGGGYQARREGGGRGKFSRAPRRLGGPADAQKY